MLRLNVAPDQFATGRWVVHLYARDGDEHIFQIHAASATHAARLALGIYDTKTAAYTQVTSVLGAAPAYPDPIRHVLSVDE